MQFQEKCNLLYGLLNFVLVETWNENFNCAKSYFSNYDLNLDFRLM